MQQKQLCPDQRSVKQGDKLVDMAVQKLFKTFYEHNTCDIRTFVGLRNLKERIDERLNL